MNSEFVINKYTYRREYPLSWIKSGELILTYLHKLLAYTKLTHDITQISIQCTCMKVKQLEAD